MILALLLAAAVGLAPAAPTPPESPSAAPTAAPSPLAPATGPTPSAPASPAPSAPMSPTPTATPTPSPYKYRFVPRRAAHPAPGTPEIYAVYLNDRQLRSLGPIHIKVETTPDVVKVVSRSNGRDGIVPQVAPGDFEATSTLPKIPFIASGMTLDLEFIATGADGRNVVVRVPVRLN